MNQVLDYRQRAFAAIEPQILQKLEESIIPEAKAQHPVLAVMLLGYVYLTRLAMSGGADNLPETEQAEINRKWEGLHKRLPFEQGLEPLATLVALEKVSALMHDAAYSDLERATERGILEKGKPGAPQTAESNMVTIKALELHLLAGKTDCEIADILCDKPWHRGKRHKHSPYPYKSACAEAFRKRRVELKKFLDSCGVEITPF